MIITVTQKHIDATVKQWGNKDTNAGQICTNCPVAIALQEATGFSYAWTDGTMYGLTDMSEPRAMRLPEHVIKWISFFDRTWAPWQHDYAATPQGKPDDISFEVSDIYIRWQEDIQYIRENGYYMRSETDCK